MRPCSTASFPNPAVLGGKACVRGTRLSVEFLLDLAASGASRDEIVARYPALHPIDVEQAFRSAGDDVAVRLPTG